VGGLPVQLTRGSDDNNTPQKSLRVEVEEVTQNWNITADRPEGNSQDQNLMEPTTVQDQNPNNQSGTTTSSEET